MSKYIDVNKLPIIQGTENDTYIAVSERGEVIRTTIEIPDLNDYYTKTQVDNKVAKIESELTGYATEQWVKQQGYVTDSDVNDYVGNEIGQIEERFNDYYTKAEIDDKLEDIEIPESDADLSNYYTKAEIDDKLENIEIPETDVDLSNYYTKTEIDTKIGDINNILTTI